MAQEPPKGRPLRLAIRQITLPIEDAALEHGCNAVTACQGSAQAGVVDIKYQYCPVNSIGIR